MQPDDPPTTLLETAWAALRAGRDSDVLAALDALPETLSEGARARAEAWRAQALRGLGRVEEADRAIVLAIRLAKQAGDVEGVRELRGLQASIVASLAHHRTAEAERAKDAALVGHDDAVLLHGALDDEERSQRYLRRGQAQLDVGDTDAALRSFEASLARARDSGSARPQVLALLACARAHAAAGRVSEVSSRILDAHAIADASDDMNLVTAVAHAARAVGVRIPPPEFG